MLRSRKLIFCFPGRCSCYESDGIRYDIFLLQAERSMRYDLPGVLPPNAAGHWLERYRLKDSRLLKPLVTGAAHLTEPLCLNDRGHTKPAKPAERDAGAQKAVHIMVRMEKRKRGALQTSLEWMAAVASAFVPHSRDRHLPRISWISWEETYLEAELQSPNWKWKLQLFMYVVIPIPVRDVSQVLVMKWRLVKGFRSGTHWAIANQQRARRQGLL